MERIRKKKNYGSLKALGVTTFCQLEMLRKWENTMDSAAQADGEKRVKQFLIVPLQRRGLAKPSTLTKGQFEDMVKDLCARLAYMTEQNLQALEDQCAGNAGGKGKDRFPIANHILDWAGQIQSPEGDGSPLVRAVFSQNLGLDALAQGWAPELLAELKQSRRWPNAFVVGRIRERADNSIRQLRRVEERLARGDEVPANEAAWRNRRLSAIRRCQAIADLGANQGGGE